MDKTQDEVAAYADFRQNIGQWLSLNAGVRVDHHSPVGTELIPQGGLAFHLPRQAELKVMASKGFRNPTIREMYMFPPQNPSLRPERLMNYELSFSQQTLGGSLTYGANLYYINGKNLIMTLPNAEGRPQNVNTGVIENWGVEGNVAWRINTCWSTQANYSWVHMEHPVMSAPEHKLYVGGNFKKGRWSLATGIQYINGLYTSISPVSTEKFVLWNLRGAYKFCSFATIFLRGENLLAQRYAIMQGYPMPKATFLGGIHISI